MQIIRRLLAMEPVAVQGVVRLAFVLLATVGVTVSDEISGQVLAAIAAAYALLEAVTTLWARSKATPDAKVVAVVEPDGTTVAGPASPLPDGTLVAEIVEDKPSGLVPTHCENCDATGVRSAEFEGTINCGTCAHRLS